MALALPGPPHPSEQPAEPAWGSSRPGGSGQRALHTTFVADAWNGMEAPTEGGLQSRKSAYDNDFDIFPFLLLRKSKASKTM